MKDMICPRCEKPLNVDKVDGKVEITCFTCGFCSDVADNVRDAQKEFFSNVSLMDSLDKLRSWAKRNGMS